MIWLVRMNYLPDKSVGLSPFDYYYSGAYSRLGNFQDTLIALAANTAIACFCRFLYNSGAFKGRFIQAIGTTMKTYFANSETAENKWYVVDASGKVLGRLASQIAKYLRGKHKPEFTPHADAGDYIIVINAEKIKVTGNKAKDKMYYSHSGFPGGIKEISYEKLQEKDPRRAIQFAVKGMMPKNPLGRDMLRKLRVFVGAEHPHTAQQPITINLDQAE
jgi:large subunit ribosomal protein L13